MNSVSSKVLSTKAIVVKTLTYKNSDLIATLITEDKGKISCFCRGAKNSKKRYGGGISPLDLGIAELGVSNSELYTLKSFNNRVLLKGIRESMLKFALTCLTLECCSSLLVEEDNCQEFDIIWDGITKIAKCSSGSRAYHASVFSIYQVLKIAGLDPAYTLSRKQIEIIGEKNNFQNFDKKEYIELLTLLVSFTEDKSNILINSKTLLF